MSSLTRATWQCPFSAGSLIAPPHTPFTADGSGVALGAIPPFASWLAREGFNAVFVCGTNGESYACSVAERKAVLEAWMATPEVESKQLRAIAHVSCQAMPETLDLAQHAAALGVDAIAYMVPCFFKPTSDAACAQLLAHVAAHVPSTPVLLYHFPDMTGVVCNVAHVLKLASAEAPNVVGCKFTHTDLGDFEAAAKAGFSMLMGPGDDLLLPSLVVGGHGGFSVPGMFGGAKAMREVAAAVARGDLAAATAWQAHAALQMKLVAGHPAGFVAYGKALASVASGVALGPPRLPLASLDDDTSEPAVAATAKAIRSMAALVGRQTSLPTSRHAVAVGTKAAAAGPAAAMSKAVQWPERSPTWG